MKSNFTRSMKILLLVIGSLFSAYQSLAQYTATDHETGKWNVAVAKDNSNNIYTVRWGGANYEVAKYDNGNPASVSVIHTGLNNNSQDYPWGLAVNASGAVFVTNPDPDAASTIDWQIIKLTPSGATYTPSVIHTGGFYTALAIDASNNLLAMEYNSATTSYQVMRYPANNEQAAGTLVWNGLPLPATTGTYPWGMVADAQNNIYVTGFHETGGGQLFKLTASSGYSPTTLMSNRSFTSIAIDGAGNFYTIEGVNATTSRVMKYTDITNPATGAEIYGNLHNNVLFYPWGLTVNSSGEVFVGDGQATAIPPSTDKGKIIKLSPPGVMATAADRLDPTPTNAATVRYTVTFSGAVTGVANNSFTINAPGITGAAVSNISGSGNSYTVTVGTGTGSGNLQLVVNGNGISPSITNAPFNGQTYVIDRTGPAVTSVTATPSYYSAGETLDLTVNFGENVQVTGTPSIDITIGATTVQANYVSGSGSNALIFRYTVADGNLDPNGIAVGASIQLNGGTLQDALGNAAALTLNGIGDMSGVLVDAVAPTVASVTVPADGYYKAGDVLLFRVTMSETVTIGGHPYFDVVIGTTTVQAQFVNNVGNVLTFIYTVVNGDNDMDGIAVGNTIKHTSSSIRDAAGNNAALPLNNVGNTSGVFVNTNIPSVTLTGPSGSIVNGTFTATATFSEAMTGLTMGEFNVTNATLSGLSTTDNITYTVQVTPLADGTVTVQIPAGVAANIAGNNNTASNTLSYTYNSDNVPPSVNLVTLPPAGTYTAGDVLNFAIRFNENVLVTGTPYINITVGSTVIPANYTGGSGTNTLNFSYTVQAGDNDNNGITIQSEIHANGGTIQDGATNAADLTFFNLGATGINVDALSPIVTSVAVPVDGYYKAGDVLNFTVNFDENVVVTGTPYLNLTIGSTVVQANYASGTGTQALRFAYTVQAGQMDMDGIAVGTLQLNGGTIRDVAGNNAVITLNNVGSTANVFVNTTIPSVVVSTTAGAVVNAPFTVTITFSEPVTGLTSGDLNVTNGTPGALNTTDNITYTALVTPTADGTVTVRVLAGAANNIGGNANTASSILSLTYDNGPPVVTSVDVPANGYYKTGDVMNFTVHFDENVTVTGAPYLDITIGSTTVHAGYTGGTGSNTVFFAYTVQAGQMDLDGITIGAVIQLNGGTIRDVATNAATLTLNNVGNTSNVFVYTSTPTVQISGTPSPNAPWTATVTFSEAVTGFAVGNIVSSNATLSSLQTTDNITYTILVTPIATGAVSIQVPADAAFNVVSNGNTASNIINYNYDGTVPVITSVTVPANAYYKAGAMLNFTVQFSENVTVTGAPVLPVTIGASNVQAAYVSGSSSNVLVFRYTVQNGDMDMDGIALGTALALNGSTIQDAATNNASLTLNNVGSTAGVFVNTAHPSVTLSTTAATRVNAPFTVTVTFSEAVTGLALNDFTVTNASVSNLQTSDNITFTVLVTPAADGSAGISLPADVVVNIGDNGNTASNTITRTYDHTAPVITAASFTILENSAVGTQVGTLTATETAGTLQSWTITSDGSGGAFAIDQTGKITVNDMAILNSKAGTTVTVSVTVSDGLNTSTALPVSIQIQRINQAPTLDAITNVSVCANTETHTIQLTGASAVEPTQTYAFTVVSNQPYFDVLSVNASGLLSYQLKPAITSGTATVTVTIKDNGGTANGGVDAFSRSFTITVNSLPVVTITSDKGNTISKGDTIRLTATGGATYNWDNVTGIISGQQTAVLTARAQQNTTYTVTAVSAAGCSTQATINIATIEDFKVDATNILTPNGDGRNDRWVIRNIDTYPDNEIKIFDRAGRVVYQQRNYNNTWNGTLNGSPLAEGTYYYILSIQGGKKVAKGFITIIRDRY